MLSSPEFWFAVSFVLFVALVVYLKVPQMIAKALDERAEVIRNELDEARKLHEEAQAVLADYQRKRRDAEQEASNIITQAEAEAESLSAEAIVKMQDMLERRLKAAETKILQAEQQATDDVRIAAADAAIAAAESVIAGKLNAKAQSDLISESIKSVKAGLN